MNPSCECDKAPGVGTECGEKSNTPQGLPANLFGRDAVHKLQNSDGILVFLLAPPSDDPEDINVIGTTAKL